MKLFTRKSTTPPKPSESPAQLVKRTEAELQAARMRDQYAEERRVRDAQREAEAAQILSGRVVTLTTMKADRRANLRSHLINFGPLIIINALAVIGQFGWFAANLADTFGPIGSYVVAVFAAGALETIALFLGYHAMRALQRKDSAAGMLLGSMVIATVVAIMNYSHFAASGFRPTTAAVSFGLFSFIAPFLWRIKIRSDHRDELATNGEIDRRGLKLERSRIFWHPLKSLKVIRHAAWTGQRNADLAVKEWEASRTGEIDVAWLEADYLNMIHDGSVTMDRIPRPTSNALPQMRRNAIHSNDRYPVNHVKWEDAISTYAASLDAGQPMKVKDLAEHLGMANRVLAGKAREYVHSTRGIVSNGQQHNDGPGQSPETA
jgi:uncharacterized protein YeaO (DUF488 family)